MHDQSASAEVDLPKEYVCSEAGCGKVFKYASKLRKHEDSHGKSNFKNLICCEVLIFLTFLVLKTLPIS